jgi:SOS-response transcriptional repressor LexA
MTPRQRDLLRFIERYQADNDGVSPSFEEMAVGIGLASTSKSSVLRLLEALERDGLITRGHGWARNIRLSRPTNPLLGFTDGEIALEFARRFHLASGSSLPTQALAAGVSPLLPGGERHDAVSRS